MTLFLNPFSYHSDLFDPVFDWQYRSLAPQLRSMDDLFASTWPFHRPACPMSGQGQIGEAAAKGESDAQPAGGNAVSETNGGDSIQVSVNRKEEAVSQWAPRFDVSQPSDEELVIKAELPGVEKKNVNIDLDGDNSRGWQLRISAKHGYRNRRENMSEAFYGSVSRVIPLPANAIPERISNAKW
jgi:HSP20 family molecular chaperone IbpA